MEQRKLGRTGIEVSKICLGTMTWGEQNTEQEAHEQLDYALANGVNFIDTAEMYPVPPGKETYATTERYIGSWIKARGKRDDFVLASKIAGPTGANRLESYIRNGNDFSRAQIIGSLRCQFAALEHRLPGFVPIALAGAQGEFFWQIGRGRLAG